MNSFYFYSIFFFNVSLRWVVVVIFQLLSSWVQLLSTTQTAAHQASLSFTIPWNVLTHVHWVMSYAWWVGEGSFFITENLRSTRKKKSTVSHLGEPWRLKLLNSRAEGQWNRGARRHMRGVGELLQMSSVETDVEYGLSQGPQTETPRWAAKMSHGAQV